MKLRYVTITEIDLKDLLLAKSMSTIRRKINQIIGEGEAATRIIAKAKEIAGFIKADADATFRLIEARPEREEEYIKTWALCSDKQLQTLRQMILDATMREKVEVEELDPCFEPEEIRTWVESIPAPKPKPDDGTPPLPGTDEDNGEDQAPEDEPEEGEE